MHCSGCVKPEGAPLHAALCFHRVQDAAKGKAVVKDAPPKQPAEAPRRITRSQSRAMAQQDGRSKSATRDARSTAALTSRRSASLPARPRRQSQLQQQQEVQQQQEQQQLSQEPQPQQPPPSPLPDIDAPDRHNHLAECNYVNDVYSYFRRIEPKFKAPANYMDSQVGSSTRAMAAVRLALGLHSTAGVSGQAAAAPRQQFTSSTSSAQVTLGLACMGCRKQVWCNPLWRLHGLQTNSAPCCSGLTLPFCCLQQTDINEKMRAILIDWLVEVHLKFKVRRQRGNSAWQWLGRAGCKQPLSVRLRQARQARDVKTACSSLQTGTATCAISSSRPMHDTLQHLCNHWLCHVPCMQPHKRCVGMPPKQLAVCHVVLLLTCCVPTACPAADA